MPHVTSHQPGMFCWADLATTDPEGAKAFYTALLGLEAADVPAEDGSTYTMLMKEGQSACALYALDESLASQGVPPHWQVYFAVTSADEVAKKAGETGGMVMAPPFNVGDFGRMAVMTDPEGAVFAVWEARGHIGAQVFGEPGTLAWAELYVRDPEGTQGFYTGLFGWEVQQVPSGVGAPYRLFTVGGQPASGMLEIQEEWGEMPPNWSVYFAVENLEEALAKVAELGGSVETDPMEVPGVGSFAVASDPSGAYFLMIQSVMGAE